MTGEHKPKTTDSILKSLQEVSIKTTEGNPSTIVNIKK